ncbi:hypothetical protein AA313_de0207377 [Arthrobotrys entomopaga]|nr:hypothetical protein AA313_de0207377 [Arthrobotrys entomopaga]
MRTSIFGLGFLVAAGAMPQLVLSNKPIQDIGSGSEWTGHRYAYKAVHDKKNDNIQSPKDVIPMTQYAVNGETYTDRVEHTHSKLVPRGRLSPRDAANDVNEEAKTTTSSQSHTRHSPGPVIHNPTDLVDILFTDKAARNIDPEQTTDNVHAELSTRTLPYSTDENGRVFYRVSVYSVYHTHPANGPIPIAPDINPNLMNRGTEDNLGEQPIDPEHLVTAVPAFTITAVEHMPNGFATDVAAPASSEIEKISIQTAAAAPSDDIQRLGKVGLIHGHIEPIHGDDLLAHSTQIVGSDSSSVLSNRKLDPVGSIVSDGLLDSISDLTGPITKAPRPTPLGLTSTIYDLYMNRSVTVTYDGDDFWKQPSTDPWSGMPTTPPGGETIAPVATMFDPLFNITYEYIQYKDPNPDAENPVSIWYHPIATGEAIRPQDKSVQSEYWATAHPHNLPSPQLVFDSYTNVTWNRTFEGPFYNWVEVYSAISTGWPPSFTKSSSELPEWPGKVWWKLLATDGYTLPSVPEVAIIPVTFLPTAKASGPSGLDVGHMTGDVAPTIDLPTPTATSSGKNRFNPSPLMEEDS